MAYAFLSVMTINLVWKVIPDVTVDAARAVITVAKLGIIPEQSRRRRQAPCLRVCHLSLS